MSKGPGKQPLKSMPSLTQDSRLRLPGENTEGLMPGTHSASWTYHSCSTSKSACLKLVPRLTAPSEFPSQEGQPHLLHCPGQTMGVIQNSLLSQQPVTKLRPPPSIMPLQPYSSRLDWSPASSLVPSKSTPLQAPEASF